MSSERAWNTGFSRVLRGLSFSAFIAFVSPAHGQAPNYYIESVETKQRYEILTLDEYSFVYSDRDFVFTEVPSCMKGSRYIVTANSDKFSVGPRFLTMYSKVPLTIYIGYDQRYRRPPEWLTGAFEQVQNLRLAMGEPKLGKTLVVYDMYRASFRPGRIQLGGNLAEREKSNYAMYTAIIVEEHQDRCR